jgi:hypothetical protein
MATSVEASSVYHRTVLCLSFVMFHILQSVGPAVLAILTSLDGVPQKMLSPTIKLIRPFGKNSTVACASPSPLLICVVLVQPNHASSPANLVSSSCRRLKTLPTQ